MTRARNGGYSTVHYRTVLYWTIPCLACLLVHWQGFTAWFRADDFAWLSNLNTVHSFHDLLVALFIPRAQGTIRPFSERAFFMIGYGLFGLDSLPFRIVIFATQFADLALTAVVGAKLTGSRAAGFCATLLWTVNSTSVQPLAWACVYNEVMCAFFLLLAFYFLLRYIETGKRRYHVWEWVVFLLGFGALELNVVYPALAAAYTLLCARRFFRGTLPMAAVSAAYTILHMLVAPSPTSGVYVMHFGASMLHTLAVYWTWSIGPAFLEGPRHIARWMLMTGVALISLTLLAILIAQLRRGYRAALFCVAWYLITLAPMLPLRDHVTEYYPFIGVIGLAWLGAWGLVEAWGFGPGGRAAALAAAAIYAGMVLPRTVSASEWNHRLTMRARDLVEGVAGAHELHPGKAILLYGADLDQYWNVVRDSAFPLIGIDNVYLAPGTEKRLVRASDWGSVTDYVLAPGVAASALDRSQLEVYDVRGAQLRNITMQYAATLRDRALPLRLSAADGLTAYLLGPEWYHLDIDHRWMPKRATLRMGAPSQPGEKLYLNGYAPDGGGGEDVSVTVDGVTLPAQPVRPGPFEAAFRLPDSVTGEREMHVVVEVNRTFTPPGDNRELGLSFGVFEVK
jgi:hypothetical protein